MAGRLQHHREVAPRTRVAAEAGEARDGYFYPREAATILGCPEIDYRQLRRLFELARRQAGRPVPRGWARFTLEDLAAIRVAIDLCEGPDDVRVIQQPGRRLQMAAIERACFALHKHGIDNPLLNIDLVRLGRKVLAEVKGELVDPTTGQLALGESYTEVAAFLREREIRDSALAARMKAERKRSKPNRSHAGRGLRTVEPEQD